MYLDYLKYKHKDIKHSKLEVLMFNVELEIKLNDEFDLFSPEVKDEIALVLFYLENNRNNINKSVYNNSYTEFYNLIIELIEFVQSKVK